MPFNARTYYRNLYPEPEQWVAALEGAKARRAGLPRSACPYHREFGAAWRSGWNSPRPFEKESTQ